ncbi:protein HEATR9 isoform X2 [Bos taurus]|uniref:protein HEATR9 isoform X2 n=1 Tax=Bos taurus TaxID=9913 RepID=UPI000383CD9C|nr:protein HEATR9 isoform X2 [Bos taurus]
MAYEKSVNISDINRAMFNCPWLEYPGRIKELRRAAAPVLLPWSCHQAPKEEFPPSPECWREHPSKPNAVPYCYYKKPELYTHWYTLYDRRKEREAQKTLRKMRDHPRYLKEGTLSQKLRLPMSKLTRRSPVESKPLDPAGEPLKWQRLKELTESLKSPREDEQLYAAQRTQVEDEEKLVLALLMLIKKSGNKAAAEAALCLGFLRPHSNVAREYLLQCLCQGPKTQQMKALTVLVKIMGVHSATVVRSILDQLSCSSVLEHRFEATQMLKAIGLEWIQAHGLEELTFDLLRRKTYNEPFFAIRQAVAETVEELKMKPMMLNLVEAQLMSSNAIARQEAVISLSVLGIRSPQVFHLVLDMLDVEKNASVKKSLQETLILLASIDPWIQNKLKNKVLFVCEMPKTSMKVEFTRFRKEPENPEETNIQDFKLIELNPLFLTKSSAMLDRQKKLNPQKGSDTPGFLPSFSISPKHQSQGPWAQGIRKQLQTFAETPN